MNAYLMSFVRITIVLALALLSMPLLRTAPAAARRLVLSVAFVFVLAIPFVPAWHVIHAPAVDASALFGRAIAEPAVLGSFAPSTIHPRVASSSDSSHWIDWLAIVYAMGALVVVLRFVIGAVLARRIALRAMPLADATGLRAIATLEKNVEVRVSRDIASPALTGILFPIVLVPESSRTWSEARWTSVLIHELAHVAAFDLVVQALASIACGLHWFNPLAWLALRRLRFERELAADEAVLRAGTKASSYAEDLLAVAGAAAHGGMIAIAEHPLKKRIIAIVDAKRPTTLNTRNTLTLVMVAAAVSAAAACTASPESPTPHTATAAATNTGNGIDNGTGATNTTGTTSIAVNRELQAIVESELAQTVKQWNAVGGTILVLSPKGEVLADAGGRSTRPYVAGSTMKPIFLAVAIDEGVVKDNDTFDCAAGQRGAKTIHDAEPHGSLSVAEMLAVSSNIGFANVFDRLGGARADRALRRFHFTPPAALASQPAGDWDGALTVIGATMTTTPLEVAAAYAMLAHGGDGVVKPSTAERVGTLLEGVVALEKGTGKKARIDGVRVAGKTGSSEWLAKDGATATYASFVGFVPADRPRYVIFVGIEGAKDTPWGGAVAAPVFSRVATNALARP